MVLVCPVALKAGGACLALPLSVGAGFVLLAATAVEAAALLEGARGGGADGGGSLCSYATIAHRQPSSAQRADQLITPRS